MGTFYGVGQKASHDAEAEPRIINDENTQSTIEDMIADSAQVLDLRSIPDGTAIIQAIAVTDDNGKPGALVISFAKGETDDNDVVTAESERTTIIVPINHAFTFGNGVVLALDKAADALVNDKVKQMVERILGGDR